MLVTTLDSIPRGLTRLSLKPWITPSLFDNTGNPAIVDEWTFGQFQDPNVALTTLTNHWDNWITQNDFALIAAAGCVELSATFGASLILLID